MSKSKMSKFKMSKSKQMRIARELSRRQSNHHLEAYECLGALVGQPAIAKDWTVDFAELAYRIQCEGEHRVPNRDRDLLAKNLPLGSLTRHDGTSIRPQYRELANG